MADTPFVILGTDGQGNTQRVALSDSGLTDGNGNKLYQLQVDTELSLNNPTISANMSIKDGVAATLAKVAATTGIAEGDNALAVQAPVLGVSSGAAVVTDASGTIQQYLRGLVKLIAAKIGVTIADGDSATLGITTGAAVVTDANGTVQQYLRGLVKLIVAKINVKVADGDNAVEGVTTGAAVVTDANGTLQGYLRGLVKLFAAVLPASIGQKAMAASLPVVIASDQSTFPTSATDLGYDVSVVNNLGVGGARFTSADQSASPAAITDAPGVSKRLVVTDIIISLATALTVTLTEETTGTVLFSLVLPTGSFVIPLRGKLKLATANKRLMLQTSLIGGVSASVLWYAE